MTVDQLAKLDQAITEARERLDRLLTARAVLLELSGRPAEAPPCSCHGDRAAGKRRDIRPAIEAAAAEVLAKGRPAAPPTVATKRDRQLRVAREMLAHGSMGFAEVRQFLGVSNDTTAKLLRSPWFEKVDGAAPGSPAPWQLSDAGRAAVSRGGVPPASELRPNADLDDVFLAELRRESPAGKADPGPPTLGGPGSVRRNVLAMLADGPKPFTSLCRALPVNPSSVGKAMAKLEAEGLIRKPGLKADRSPWELTARGEAELNLIPTR